MKFNLHRFQKRIFCVNWTPGNLTLLLWGPSGILRYESLFLQEASSEGMTSQVTSFLKNEKPRETLLILPRSEILQKEIFFEGSKSSSRVRENFEAKLAQILPYSPREMAYGLVLENEEQNTKGLLYAITEKKMQDILDFTASLGIQADEVVSEDQTLCWNGFEESSRQTVLMVEQSSDRILFAAVRNQRICISRTVPKEKEDVNSAISEAALCLLELGQKPGKVIYSGAWSEEELRELQRQFPVSIEKLETVHFNGQSISAPLSGTRFFGKYSFTSLLPGSKKVKRWQVQQARLFKTLLGAVGVFTASCLLFGVCHLLFLKSKNEKLAKEAESLSVEIKDVKEMAASLGKMEKAEFSKRRVLDLMKDLAERMPGAIKLNELQIEEKDLLFRGESPSHALLSEAVQVFEKEKDLQEIKLDHTRLRRRLNQDYFEFEVSGKWKN